MAAKPNPEFGKRRPARPPRPGPPVKRSNHVALLVMGTLAVGGGAYALMPRENCQPPQPAPPGMAAPAVPQPGADCPPRNSSSSSGGHGGGGSSSRSSFYSGDSSPGRSSSSTSSSNSVSRGGFGSFAHAFGFGGG
ncbi:hypothetical protein MTX26_29435 [Bradyrhizobium sp. ISRA443]|uniref:hypothetical protein n=1 Tax=unclassified Bradyrhizobium TaxID=2631580 RepID=UPI00247AB4C0|nr:MULTISPECIES: hypothetical protein [unclassified Bradyrhizobium]WGR95883.1 hypothetical protein MTX20_04375 [Bradyrhizobium sp. ISRA435]WGR98337.1 hypothetical protein MTX23_29425 [Bradyrhizobium sp. ISRA436]WGS05225.1 hypothetical protein MTX18_29440 [Bradyrhizobium sp. ISRA437]WGS12111.1 hypothetical protein MTX26_29435 [Bradyrhizobium sp. ISRA443]